MSHLLKGRSAGLREGFKPIDPLRFAARIKAALRRAGAMTGADDGGGT